MFAGVRGRPLKFVPGFVPGPLLWYPLARRGFRWSYDDDTPRGPPFCLRPGRSAGSQPGARVSPSPLHLRRRARVLVRPAHCVAMTLHALQSSECTARPIEDALAHSCPLFACPQVCLCFRIHTRVRTTMTARAAFCASLPVRPPFCVFRLSPLCAFRLFARPSSGKLRPHENAVRQSARLPFVSASASKTKRRPAFTSRKRRRLFWAVI